MKRIEIYPYGGCSKLEYDINVRLWKELLVLIMGPVTQIVFVFLIGYFHFQVENYFYTYHFFILSFNLLPIYPLDGGRLLHLILANFCSFYQSLKCVFYFSIFAYFCILFYIIFFERNLMFVFIIFLLSFKIYKEISKAYYYFQKFLMERYLHNYSFSKIKKVTKVQQMRRDYYHYFIDQGNIVSETERLSYYFS